MRHSYIDAYGDRDSFIHRLDPRIKIAAFFGFILFIIFTPPTAFKIFFFYALLLAVLIVPTKIPLGFISKRSMVVIPFVLMIAIFLPFIKQGEIAGGYSFGSLELTVTYDGLIIFFNVLVKAYLSVLCMILLMATTEFSYLLKALEELNVPKLITMILSFMYRYIFVVQDELLMMQLAKASRTTGGSRWFHVKTLANMLGVLFLRTYERAESVYLAMCSRGFNGRINTIKDFRITKKDWVFLAVMLISLIGIRLL